MALTAALWVGLLGLAGCDAGAPAATRATDVADDGAPAKKRAAPPRLAEVVHRGVRYAELRAGRGRGLAQNGGHIVATDTTSGAELWVQQVYGLAGSADLETDKREVYITRLSLSADGSQLLIENERQERYALRLSDRAVQRQAP